MHTITAAISTVVSTTSTTSLTVAIVPVSSTVIATSAAEATTLVSITRLLVVSPTTLEAVGTTGAVKSLVDADHTPVKSAP